MKSSEYNEYGEIFDDTKQFTDLQVYIEIV